MEMDVSANIYFEPIDPHPRAIGTFAPSSFQEAMRKAGFELPCVLDASAVPVLSGMAATFGSNSPNPYEDIIEAIETHGKIRLWAEY